MGEMYHEGEYDVAGFAVGAVEKDDYVDGSEVKEGQVVIGLCVKWDSFKWIQFSAQIN